jgi:hypothetical protein
VPNKLALRLPGGDLVQQRWLGSMCAIGVVYAALLLVQPAQPHASFVINDNGVRYLQHQALLANGGRSFGLNYPGQNVDAGAAFSPFRDAAFFYRGRDGDMYSVYAGPLTAVHALFANLLGGDGALAVNIVAGIGVALGTLLLHRAVSGRDSEIAPLVVCLASPMVYYAIDYWDTLPNAALVTLGVALLFIGARRDRTDMAAGVAAVAAGALLGLSVAVRAENYPLLPACALALVWLKRGVRASLPMVVPFTAGASLLLAALWLFNLNQSGSILGGHLGTVARVASSFTLLDVVRLKPYTMPYQLVPFESARWLLWCAGALVLVGITRVVPAARRTTPRLVALAIYCVTFLGLLFLELRAPTLSQSLLRTFPLLVGLYFLPGGELAGARRISDQLRWRVALLAIVVTFWFGLTLGLRGAVAPGDWGPRYMMGVLPLLIVACLVAFDGAATDAAGGGAAQRLRRVGFVALILLSLLSQLQGLAHAHTLKNMYGRLTALIAGRADTFIVTDIWWLPQMSARVFDEKVFLLVNHGATGELDAALATLERAEVRSFTFVSSPNRAVSSGQLPAAAQWEETDRVVEHIWLPVEYRRYEYR